LATFVISPKAGRLPVFDEMYLTLSLTLILHSIAALLYISITHAKPQFEVNHM
jgi:hypothetical protein